MSELISVEYTDPEDGLNKIKSVTLDLTQFRPDDEPDAQEIFQLKATASGVTDIFERVAGVAADILDGKPSSKMFGIVQAYVDIAFTANGTTLSTVPAANTAGFQANVPCVVLSKYGTVAGYCIPTAVGADLTLPATGGGALGVDAKVGYIVQMLAPYGSPLGENSVLGVKAQFEQPGKPSATAAGAAGPSINVTITAAATKKAVVTHYDIYLSPTSFKVGGTEVIEPNRTPDKADVAVASIGSPQNVTTYGGGTDAGGGSLSGATTYYVVVVAKDGTGQVDVNESPLSSEVTAATP